MNPKLKTFSLQVTRFFSFFSPSFLSAKFSYPFLGFFEIHNTTHESNTSTSLSLCFFIALPFFLFDTRSLRESDLPKTWSFQLVPIPQHCGYYYFSAQFLLLYACISSIFRIRCFSIEPSLFTFLARCY